MIKRNHIFVKIIIGICLIFLIGCDSQEPEALRISETSQSLGALQIPEDTAMSDSKIDTLDSMSDNPTDDTTEKETAGIPTYEDDYSGNEIVSEEAFHVPTLPDTGSGLMDFVPDGWTLWDSVELDFNEDKIPDYVGVLDMALPDTETSTENEIMPDYVPPRILFAIASDGAGLYCLDFQDINLIRTRGEGGIFGDPYEPLTAEGTSFTTHAYGGSAWRWSEENTYTYNAGVWYKTMSESAYGYGPFITSYEKDDWSVGVGIRKKRSDNFDDMEKYLDSEGSWEEEKFDVEYQISLDEPPTLEQAGMRWWLASERVTDWGVDSIEFSEGIELPENRVKSPGKVYLTDDCNEDCVLYRFQDQDNFLYYLAMYRFQDRKLTVLAESDTVIGDTKLYKGKVYYCTEIVEELAYKQMKDGQEQIVEEKGTVGIRLNRMNLDGSGKETVFEYRYPGTEQEILENRLPYLSLIYEISGEEIVAEVYVGSEPHPVYRMGSDGSGLEWIGQIPAES